jgi:DNA-binding GntR family transcriptional regulator
MTSSRAIGAAGPGAGTGQLTLLAAAQLRGMIIDGVLLPGEKIRQVDLAARVGVSRSPLREALRMLASEGVLTYQVNRGYVVSRLELRDQAQIMRMRALLESDLLMTIQPPSASTLAALARCHAEMLAAIDRENVLEILRANRDFHFLIFALSPMNQVSIEVQRLWQLSEGYQTTWWRTPEAKPRIDREHRAIMAALGNEERGVLVELCNRHRVGGHNPSILATCLPLGLQKPRIRHHRGQPAG